MSDRNNLAAFTNGATRRQAIVGVAMAFGGLALASTKAWAEAEGEISHTAESIHQEVIFKASRKRFVDALPGRLENDFLVNRFRRMRDLLLGFRPSLG